MSQSSLTTAVGARAAAVRGKLRTRAALLTPERFVGLTLAICLLLQRFALPFGSLSISLATPLVLVLALWALRTGVLTLERRRAACFLGLLGIALIAWAAQFTYPLAFAPRTSLNSLAYWLGITGFAIFRLREPMEEGPFFRIVNYWLAIVAIAGIVEFFGQFVGLKMFAFTGVIPSQFLIEHEYAVVIPLQGSGIVRSNGFFLVEPSVFSQLMGVAIVIEWLYFRRPAWLAVFFAGLLVSVSGTGWLILIAFLFQNALTSGLRGSLRMLALACACIAALALANLVMPEITGTLFGRVNEFSETRSSGYARFITPLMALSQVLHRAPWTLLTGLGPGAATDLLLPFHYWLNTPVKLVLEYGIFGFILYVGLLVVASRTPRQTAMLLPLLVLLMFTGGYQEFSPILFPTVLMTSVAFLRPARGHAR